MCIQCEICKDKKHIRKDGKWHVCICVLKEQYRNYLGVFANSEHVEKSILMTNATKSLCIVNNRSIIKAHIKYYLAKQGLFYNYVYLTSSDYIGVCLGQNESIKGLSDLLKYDLVIIDLIVLSKNKCLGDWLSQILYMREGVIKPTWFLSEKSPVEIEHLLGGDSFTKATLKKLAPLVVTKKPLDTGGETPEIKVEESKSTSQGSLSGNSRKKGIDK